MARIEREEKAVMERNQKEAEKVEKAWKKASGSRMNTAKDKATEVMDGKRTRREEEEEDEEEGEDEDEKGEEDPARGGTGRASSAALSAREQ